MTPLLLQPIAGCPDLLALKRAHPERYPCLLESLARGAAPARFDLLFATDGQWLEKDAESRLSGSPAVPLGSGFLDSLRRWQAAVGPLPAQPELPFNGGWLLFLGYELAAEIEPRLQLPEAEPGFPMALALRCPVALLFDHQLGQGMLIAEPGCEPLVAAVHGDLERLSTPTGTVQSPRWQLSEDPDQQYLDGVRKVQSYLAAGDSFQINLSRGWRAETTDPVDPHALYQRLRLSNPAPFAGMLSWRGAHLLSSSPERLVEVRGRRIQTRPIAGTRPRRTDDDDFLKLPRDPKERAEHIMLIDLERNDLGRVCVAGTIEVNELLGVESYAHVHHIVSNVRGTLRPEIDASAVIAACFPGGTITGCPKVRSMQIIAELEQCGRGPYTGSLGYLERSGDLDLNILIRSMLLIGQELRLRTGAGIVVDSIPQRELDETRAKAEGLLRALNSLGASTR